MLVPKTLANMHQNTLFPGSPANAHVYADTTFRRHYLSFPQYPFRTLCPREAHRLLGAKYREFDATSPIFPAHTLLNIKFKRRAVAKLINYMLPTNLNFNLGSRFAILDEQQRNNGLEFTVRGVGPAPANAPTTTNYRITDVKVVINDMYLQVGRTEIEFPPAPMLNYPFWQVMRLRYKGLNPERPLSNVYTCIRTRFTPLQKVSLHTYDLAWESTVRPLAAFIAFVK